MMLAIPAAASAGPDVTDALDGKGLTPKQGDILYWDGGAWAGLPIGKPGQVLKTTDGVSLTWANASPRTATRVIAAGNSSADSRAQADYACDGVDDHIEIQEAIDVLPAIGGTVKLLEGTYNCASLTLNNCLLSGQGQSSIIRLAADTSSIIVHEDGKLRNIKVSVPAGYAGTAVIVEGKKPHLFVAKVDVLDRIVIMTENPWPYKNQKGTGLLIRATSVGVGKSILLNTFGDIVVWGFEYSMKLSATKTGKVRAYLCGNSFRSLMLCQGKYLLTIEGIGDGDGGICNANTFAQIQLQPTGYGTVDGIHLVGFSPGNKFLAIHAWDWSVAKGKPFIIDEGIYGTYVMGYLRGYVDNGKDNVIVHAQK